MEVLIIVLPIVTVLVIISAVLILHRERRQIKEIAEALADVKNGNGNRRVLANPSQLLSPLIYEINDIILAYEEQIAVFHQTDETNKQLMTSLSHDVRTPLTTLIGYLDAVHKGVVTGTEREEYIEISRRKAYDLKGYIDVLFDWFKLNSDEFAMTIQRTEAAELTRNILIDWIPLLEDQNIEYSIEIPNQAVIANLDPDSYLRIINNLLQNVITHSQADSVDILLTKREDIMQLSISDRCRHWKRGSETDFFPPL